MLALSRHATVVAALSRGVRVTLYRQCDSRDGVGQGRVRWWSWGNVLTLLMSTFGPSVVALCLRMAHRILYPNLILFSV